jgi:hypothetical protein
MKNLKWLSLLLGAMMLLAACQKEKSSPETTKQANSSKMILQKSVSGSAVANTSPFEIHSAGVYEGTLYMSVSFTGGEKIHQFTVNWSGNIITADDKKVIELVVFHSDANDQANTMVYDSISANILDLGITNEELTDPALWIKVINSTNSENTFFFKVTNEYVDPLTILYTRDVKVVKEGCQAYGLWGELWLESNDESPVSHYFVSDIEKTISYAPAENDLLKIEFNYSFITDSTTVCPQLKQLKAQPIRITKLTR